MEFVFVNIIYVVLIVSSVRIFIVICFGVWLRMVIVMFVGSVSVMGIFIVVILIWLYIWYLVM